MLLVRLLELLTNPLDEIFQFTSEVAIPVRNSRVTERIRCRAFSATPQVGDSKIFLPAQTY